MTRMLGVVYLYDCIFYNLKCSVSRSKLNWVHQSNGRRHVCHHECQYVPHCFSIVIAKMKLYAVFFSPSFLKLVLLVTAPLTQAVGEERIVLMEMTSLAGTSCDYNPSHRELGDELHATGPLCIGSPVWL